MAVPRIEWQCPRCERRFAIRADIETPELCPQCREASADAASAAGISVKVAQGAREAGESKTPSPYPDFLPNEPLQPAGPPPQIQEALSPAIRKYPALKFLAIVYKVIAVLIALGGLVTLVIAFIAAVTVEDTSDHYTSILLQLGGFVGSVFIAVTLYAFGELIRLFIDVEANTRRQ